MTTFRYEMSRDYYLFDFNCKENAGLGPSVTDLTPEHSIPLSHPQTVSCYQSQLSAITLIKHLLGLRFEKFIHRVKKSRANSTAGCLVKTEVKTPAATAAKLPGLSSEVSVLQNLLFCLGSCGIRNRHTMVRSIRTQGSQLRRKVVRIAKQNLSAIQTI